MASDTPANASLHRARSTVAAHALRPSRRRRSAVRARSAAGCSRILAERGHDAVGTYATRAVPGPGPRSTPPTSTPRPPGSQAQTPDVVFYPAGFTWVDGCERDPGRAYAANLEQPLNLARAAAGSGRGSSTSRPTTSSTARPVLTPRSRRPAPLGLRPGQARRRAGPGASDWAIGSSRSARPGSSGPSGRARTSPTSFSRAWPRRSRWSARPTRSPAPATGPTSPERSSGWSSSRRAA